ncbi:MAG: hypothetical protein UT24_C0029G0005 [Candidatus Woesebacteria bacterium GW2011_GWB1_39_12]|uniref:Uncharacterized protein n=1 Tax=Candidatus Woesebacteria bacterium GW2011_GWB1_39_12 TaxID=1618574 RepID=A0A0G0M476_9BACT|nr:MAG: hypothetical protein UT24_C0029G0005 [Candidatus Woesebacteria bacterium GW2011_GWB1_39_12]
MTQQTNKQPDWEKKLNKFIGWDSKFGLHISDGIDSCSGTDEEQEKMAKQWLIKFISKNFISKEKLVREINSKRHTRCMPTKDGKGCQHNELLFDLLELIKK